MRGDTENWDQTVIPDKTIHSQTDTHGYKHTQRCGLTFSTFWNCSELGKPLAVTAPGLCQTRSDFANPSAGTVDIPRKTSHF